MTRWLRLALAVQLVFFVLWGGRLLTSHRDVATVWLATDPVDPRDLLGGHYVALRYRITAPTSTHCELPIAGDTVYLQLVPTGEPVTTTDGVAVLSEPVACTLERPTALPGEVWMVGHLDPQPERPRILYGIERLYVGEDSPLRTARSGSVVAKVAINDAYEPRLVGLVGIR
jgi:hypothetical protein